MTDLISRATPAPGVDATPVYSAMLECLRVQSAAPPQGRLARLVGRTPLHPDARGWFAGALGERDLDHVLAELGGNWIVLRGVPLPVRADKPRTDAPLLVIGPPGIFSIVARRFDGQRVSADGDLLAVGAVESDGIRAALGDATRAGRLLADASRAHVEAMPLLVVEGAASLRFGRTAPTVDIVGSTQLRRWFLDRPRTVSDDTIAYFCEIALRGGHWNRQPATQGDIVRVVQRFVRLQTEIRDARRRSRRVLVVAAATLVVIAAIVVAAVLC